MRFDDRLKTVLAGDMTAGLGARSGWRQLVDLVGRGRVAADAATLGRLRALRPAVPVAVRAASARMLADAHPPAALVALLAEDEAAVAAPLLRAARLDATAWLAMLPALGATGRSILRHRRDLPDAVTRGLAAFGAADFLLTHDAAATPPTADPVAPPRFEIADLVARIDAFQRDRPAAPPAARPTIPAATAAATFAFETDAAGTIRWVDGPARAALVGLSIGAIAPAALHHRRRFADARLDIGGTSPAAGGWRLAGAPLFDPATGRFVGMRGTGRRPRAEGPAARRSPAADSLRQLVHELRTPANAIVGFAELIGMALTGPVPDPYRTRVAAIHDEATALSGAIEDLDTAARIEGRALDLRPGTVPLAPLLARVVAELAPLAARRGVALAVAPFPTGIALLADDRAAERLVARLLAALLSAGAEGERIGIAPGIGGDGFATIAIDRPRALASDDDDAPFRIDAAEAPPAGGPLLGIGFTLRLVRNLAAELGGRLTIGAGALTLRLPAAGLAAMEPTVAA